jgi:hypothetical protein
MTDTLSGPDLTKGVALSAVADGAIVEPARSWPLPSFAGILQA